MIRKPEAHEFRESGAVTAIRDVGAFAIEGAKGVRDGTAQFVGRAMLGLFGFGFLMSLALHLGPVMLLLGLAGGAAWLVKRRKRADVDVRARWRPSSLAGSSVTEGTSQDRYELSVGAVGRRAATVAVPAILFFPTGILFYMGPFALASIVYLALALLLVARLFGDRTVLRFDTEALTVVGLLGEATVLWADVGDVVVRKSSMFNLKVLFTSGVRRNVQVLARINRLGGPDTLHIPVDLLGLSHKELHALVTRLLVCRASAGDLLPPAAPRAEAPAPVGFWPGAADLPRAPAPPVRPTPPAMTADMPFDPDAIIARYMAERDQLRAEQRPDIPAPRRASFGRKVT